MVLVSFAVAVSSCLGVVAAVSTAAAVSELRRRGPYTTPAAIDIEVSARFEALPPPKKPWARGTAALCLVGALLFFLTEYLQHPSYSFHFPGPHTGTCSLSDTKRAKFYGDLGGFSHATLTNSSVANKLIEAGLMEEWNFNSLEALTNFRMAGRLDPASSMAAWGEAYALGPRANRAVTKTRKPFPSFTPEDLPAVREASLRALRLANAAIADHPISDLAKKELAYAQAAQRRYEAGPEAEVQAAAEIEYGIALREIGHGWEDTNALAMAAEAFMNFSPWDYQHANGTLTWEAKQAEALIVEVLRLDPQNALALHLYIHLVEATNPLRTGKPSAAEAEASAERMTFRKGPWWTGFGHLLHMPSHTFLRIGRYHDAVLANIHANDVDQAAEAVCKTPYGPDHNLAMLINAASWSGEVQTAEQYSRQLTDMTRKFPLATKAQGGPHREATFLLLVWTMHARWSDILAAPRPGPLDRGLCPAPTNAYAMTAWHFARTLALAATANDSSSNAAQAAVQELAALQEAAGEVEPSEPTVPGPGQGIYGCDYHALVGIYAHVAEARVLMLQGQGASAEAPLKTALEIERGMGYMEPPRLLQPVRHYLGQLLLVLGRASEAQQVFEEDLAEHPENGFALQGLYRSQEVQNASQAIKETTARLKVAWQHADAPLLAACPALGL